jgi:hypothetical protein
MLRPTVEELETAKRLEIEGAASMTGPELRRAIERERARLKRLREGRMTYDKWVAICAAMGIEIQSGKGAPKMPELIRLYQERLPVVLENRRIIEGARLTIPPDCGIARSGRATVGKLHPMGADQHITITLTFDGQRAHAYDAWLVWRHATNVRRGR